MEQSKLALALSKAQSEMQGAKKDSENPYFKSKYASLSSIWEACREALSKNEIAVVQKTEMRDNLFGVVTKIIHSSGEYEEGFFPVSVSITAKAQDMGSAITYARRYSLAAMIGIAPEDDDGNAAQKTVARSDVDLINGLINKISQSKTIEEMEETINHPKTEVFLKGWKKEMPESHSRIIGAIEEKRSQLEDGKEM